MHNEKIHLKRKKKTYASLTRNVFGKGSPFMVHTGPRLWLWVQKGIKQCRHPSILTGTAMVVWVAYIGWRCSSIICTTASAIISGIVIRNALFWAAKPKVQNFLCSLSLHKRKTKRIFLFLRIYSRKLSKKKIKKLTLLWHDAS